MASNSHYLEGAEFGEKWPRAFIGYGGPSLLISPSTEHDFRGNQGSGGRIPRKSEVFGQFSEEISYFSVKSAMLLATYIDLVVLYVHTKHVLSHESVTYSMLRVLFTIAWTVL